MYNISKWGSEKVRMSHWLPKDWKKSIVLFEMRDEKGKVTPLATGFILDFDPEKRIGVLVTCKHVAQAQNLCVRLNAKEGLPYTMISQPLEEVEKYGFIWCFHPDKDVDLAMRINFVAKNIDILAIPQSLFGKFEEAAEGDEIFFLGFPLGITGRTRLTPVVRSGIIALKGEDSTYLLDANTFPGSSGSPVFLRPTIFDWKTRVHGKITPPKFIGILQSSLTYTDYAVSPQTGRVRASFEENAGLGKVYSVDIIKQLYESKEFSEQLSLVESTPSLPPFYSYYYNP